MRTDWVNGDTWDAVAVNALATEINGKQGLDADLTAFAAKTAPAGVVVGDTDTQTLTNKTLTAPLTTNITPTAGYTYDVGTAGAPYNNLWAGFAVNIQNAGINTQINAGANATNKILTLPLGTDTIVARASVDTLTNKRMTPRIGTVASSATPSIDCTLYDQYNITALAAAITSITITGTPFDGQELRIRFKDNGTARAIAHGSSFVAGPAALLATTAINKTHLSEYVYDSVAAKWACTLVHTAGY